MDVETVLVVILYRRLNRCDRRRRYWVHPILSHRLTESQYIRGAFNVFSVSRCLIILRSNLCSVLAGEMDVKFDAEVDLGQNWSYELKPALRAKAATPQVPTVLFNIINKYASMRDADDKLDHMFINNIANQKRTKDEEPYLLQTIKDAVNAQDSGRSTVIMENTKQDKGNFVEPRKVKNDAQITEFTEHIYKQSLKVFDAIKEMLTDDKMKNEVEFLAQSYVEKFGGFVRKTQDQNIKTRLGRQKVIINTLETSNLILKRLINYLVGMDKALRSETAVFQNEVNKKMDIENSHICKRFGICRSKNGFTNFIVDVITIVLKANDKKIRQARDATTEVMKYSDFSQFMSPETQKHFQKGISDLETYDVPLLKAILHIVKNFMLHKNKPIEVIGKIDKRVNKTVGALEIVDAFENALPPNEENRLVWTDIKNSLNEWKDDKRQDISEITQTFADNIKKGTDKFDEKTAFNVERNIDLILGFL